MSVTLEDDFYPINTDYLLTFTITDNADGSAVTGATVGVSIRDSAGDELESATASDDGDGEYSADIAAISSLSDFDPVRIELDIEAQSGAKWTDKVTTEARYPSGG